MSQNKFMHPRNIYKKPPSFKDMAIKYPGFRKYAKPDITGKITIDFKNPDALRALTCTLLEKDFNLKVEIPATRLIPTIPLRLNYLLWIEDLLSVAGINSPDYSSVYGLDIGTGASCIYPLLAAKQNKWHMKASEIDHESYQVAQKNVENNDLQHLVSLRLLDGDKLLLDLVDEENSYTFSMCNPPFFSSEGDLDYTAKSRSPSRPPPHNCNTGDTKELIAPGGEIAFIVKMMNESKELGTRVRIYTSMVGHKASLSLLKLELTKLQVASMVENRFCQGHTTRWGIAWTFDSSIALQNAYQTPSQKKANVPMTFVVPQQIVDGNNYTVETIMKIVIDILKGIEVNYFIKKVNKFFAVLDVISFKNSWSHQRQKKRHFQFHKDTMSSVISQSSEVQDNGSIKAKGSGSRESGIKRQFQEELSAEYSSNVKKLCEEHQASLSKNLKIVDANKISSAEESVDNQKNNTIDNIDKKDNDDVSKYLSELTSVEDDLVTSESSELGRDSFSFNDLSSEVKIDSKFSLQQSSIEQNSAAPLLDASLIVRNLASEIHIEMLWRGGTGGKDAMHQILQYIKNRLK